MSEIALVTVNYNSSASTLGLLNSLREQDDDSLSKVIVVDNASEEADVKDVCHWIRQYGRLGPTVELVRNPENLGYFRGLNIGLKALGRLYEKVVVCNNDLLFAPNFFAELVRRKWGRNVLVVAPDVVTPDGIHQNPHAVTSLSMTRKLSYALYFSNYWVGIALLKAKRFLSRPKTRGNLGPQDIYMGIGACYILTESFFERCGELDDRVFLWGEEPLLANQVRQAGGRTVYCPDLSVMHLERQSTRTVPRRSQYLAARESYRIYRPYL